MGHYIYNSATKFHPTRASPHPCFVPTSTAARHNAQTSLIDLHHVRSRTATRHFHTTPPGATRSSESGQGPRPQTALSRRVVRFPEGARVHHPRLYITVRISLRYFTHALHQTHPSNWPTGLRMPLCCVMRMPFARTVTALRPSTRSTFSDVNVLRHSSLPDTV